MADPMLFQSSFIDPVQSVLGVPLWAAVLLIAVIMTWTLVWKGIALWKSARKNHIAWFVILLLVNTIGILELLYIFVFSEMKFEEHVDGRKDRNKIVRRKKK